MGAWSSLSSFKFIIAIVLFFIYVFALYCCGANFCILESPFEFRALEVALEAICSFLDARTTELETDAYPALDELTSKVKHLLFHVFFIFLMCYCSGNRVFLRENENNTPKFRTWASASEGAIFTTAPIQEILVFLVTFEGWYFLFYKGALHDVFPVLGWE